MEHSEIRTDLIDQPEKRRFLISYTQARNRYTNRSITRKFIYYYGKRTSPPSKNQFLNVLNNVLQDIPDKKLFGQGKNDASIIQPIELRRIVLTRLNVIQRRQNGSEYLKDLDEDPNKNTQGSINEVEIFKKFGNESIFKTEESAKTTCILGSSFSGKTTLLVTELNKLDPNEYDKIILFTESTNSIPLKKLDPDLNIIILSNFVPKVVKFLKDINEKTKNRFKFLCILDDVIELKGKVFTKMILTMRNSGISTIVLLQYVKIITPSTRNSLHDYYITQLRNEDWEYVLRAFLGSHFRELLNEKGSYAKLAEIVKEYMNGKLLHYDQRRDEIEFYTRR